MLLHESRQLYSLHKTEAIYSDIAKDAIESRFDISNH